MESVSKDFPDSFYRVVIKGVCVENSKLLLVEESEEHSGGCWELPGGGLDFGENDHEALIREVKEEMGVGVDYISKTPVYVWPNEIVDQRKMEWFYTYVVCYSINFTDLNITPTPACQRVKFFSKEELSNIKLGPQMKKLIDIFNPEDFKK